MPRDNKLRAHELKNHADRVEELIDELYSIVEETEDVCPNFPEDWDDQLEGFKGALQEKAYELETMRYEVFAVCTEFMNDFVKATQIKQTYVPGQHVGLSHHHTLDEAKEALKIYQYQSVDPIWLYGIRHYNEVQDIIENG